MNIFSLKQKSCSSGLCQADPKPKSIALTFLVWHKWVTLLLRLKAQFLKLTFVGKGGVLKKLLLIPMIILMSSSGITAAQAADSAGPEILQVATNGSPTGFWVTNTDLNVYVSPNVVSVSLPGYGTVTPRALQDCTVPVASVVCFAAPFRGLPLSVGLNDFVFTAEDSQGKTVDYRSTWNRQEPLPVKCPVLSPSRAITDLSVGTQSGSEITVNWAGCDVSNVNWAETESLLNLKSESIYLWSSDFSGANLSGWDMHFMHIYNANFDNANLSQLNLSGTGIGINSAVGANFDGLVSDGNSVIYGNVFPFADGKLTSLSGARMPNNFHGWMQNVDLSRVDFSNRDLRNSTFSFVSAPGADFTNADLSGSLLSWLDISDARFTGANFSNTLNYFHDKNKFTIEDPNDLGSARFLAHSSTSGASFKYANFTRAKFSVSGNEVGLVNYGPSNLDGVDMSGATFDSVNFADLSLRQANMTSAKIMNSSVYALDVSGSNLKYLQSSNTTGTPTGLPKDWHTFSGHLIGPYADLSHISMSNADLSGWNLTGTKMNYFDGSGANFNGANLAGASFNFSNLVGADLRNANLDSAQLDYADLNGAYMLGANLNKSSMFGAYVSGADFTTSGPVTLARFNPRARLKSNPATMTNLSNANLVNSNLKDVHFDGVDLTNANLSRSNVAGATFTNVRWQNTTCSDNTLSDNHQSGSCTTPLMIAPESPNTVSATKSGNQVSLTWSPPNNDGGASVSKYSVFASTNSGQSWNDITSACTLKTPTSCTWASFSAGSTYVFAVSASNKIGESGKSLPSSPLATKLSQSALNLVAAKSSAAAGTSLSLSTTGGSGTGLVTLSTDSPNCIPTGLTVKATAPGSCTISAAKAEDIRYEPTVSNAVTINFTPVSQAKLTLKTLSGATQAYGDKTLQLVTTGGTGTGVVNYSSSTSTCAVTGVNSDQVQALQAGVCKVFATKAASGIYGSVTSQTLSITFSAIAQPSIKITNSTLSATAGESFLVAYSGGAEGGFATLAITGTGCSKDGLTVSRLSSPGTCKVTVQIGAFGIYSASTSSSQTVTFNPATQVPLSVTASPSSSAKGSKVTLGSTGGSGAGGVTYQSSTVGCSISGSTLTVTKSTSVGKAVNCSVTAKKGASGIYGAITSSPLVVMFN